MAYRQLPLKERFKLSYILKPGPLSTFCWIWIGHTNSNPDPRFRYGTMVLHKKRILAHRFSWEQTHNVHLTAKDFVCHKCDTPKCVNPKHLFLGDKIKNILDREQKGRGPQGERQWSAKLKEIEIPIIRKLFSTGTTQAELAKLYNISQGTISCVVSNKTWKHIK